MFLFFYINVFTMARAASMQYVLMPLAVGVSKKKRTRFAEQMWTVIYYSTSFTVGVVSHVTTTCIGGKGERARRISAPFILR
jgi:TRAM1-like protein